MYIYGIVNQDGDGCIRYVATDGCRQLSYLNDLCDIIQSITKQCEIVCVTLDWQPGKQDLPTKTWSCHNTYATVRRRTDFSTWSHTGFNID